MFHLAMDISKNEVVFYSDQSKQHDTVPNSFEAIQQFLKENNMSNATDLMTFYSNTVLRILKSIGGKSMVWQDVWDDGVKLPADTVIEIWKDTSLLQNSPSWSDYLSKATSEGYDAVLAAPFYLNM